MVDGLTEKIKNLEWVKNDLKNARIKVNMLDVKDENIIEFVDKGYDEMKRERTKLIRNVL